MVFLPSAPDPSNGVVVELDAANVQPYEGDARQLQKAIKFYGRGLLEEREGV